MEINVNVKIDLSADTLAVLGSLLTGASMQTPTTPVMPMSPIYADIPPAPPSLQVKKPIKKTETMPGAKELAKELPASNGNGGEKASPELTVEFLRVEVTAAAQAGKAPAIKALLAKFDTTSVTNLDKANYSAFYNELKAL